MAIDLYKIYGTKPGLKVEDLIKHSAPFKSAGLSLVPSKVIGASYFNGFVSLNRLNPESPIDQVRKGVITPEIQELNQEILKTMPPGDPFALRSSSLGERGGSGIYQTTFFVPTGNMEKDSEIFWDREKEVYASEFSDNAKAYREKHQADTGMAILIQPVIGERHEEYFFPFFAGSAYSSYAGEPLVRIAIGLGANAVGLDPTRAIAITPKWSDYLGLSVLLKRLKKISVINLESGELKNTTISHLPKETIDLYPIPDCVRNLFSILSKVRETEGRDYYIEWASPGRADENLFLLQVAPYEDKPIKKLSVQIKGQLLAGGKDIVNHGRKKCRAIVLITEFGGRESSYLWSLNRELKDYLLIFPQTIFSRVTEGPALEYSDFSNAGVLLEKQWSIPPDEKIVQKIDHVPFFRGGQHFQQLCDREDILFIGAEGLDIKPLLDLEGAINYTSGLTVWEVETETANDYTKVIGQVFITGKPRVIDFNKLEIRSFCDSFYEAGKDAEGAGEGKLGEAFYSIISVLPVGGSLIGFNPYKVDLGKEEKSKIIEWIKLILAEGYICIEFTNDQGEDTRLAQYLKKLLEKLENSHIE